MARGTEFNPEFTDGSQRRAQRRVQASRVRPIQSPGPAAPGGIAKMPLAVCGELVQRVGLG
jgi:hypothetical protein